MFAITFSSRFCFIFFFYSSCYFIYSVYHILCNHR
jgi:hypothetical protein